MIGCSLGKEDSATKCLKSFVIETMLPKLNQKAKLKPLYTNNHRNRELYEKEKKKIMKEGPGRKEAWWKMCTMVEKPDAKENMV